MAAPKPDLTVRGATGLPIWAGRVYDEYLIDLQGERGRKVFREMSEQDPVIGGILFSIEMLARQVNWGFLPADGSPKAKKVADFIESAFKDLNPGWEDTLSEILTMLPQGWSWMEILYKQRGGTSTDPKVNSKYDDGMVGWRGFAPRAQETHYMWNYDDDGELESMSQIPPPLYGILTIPRSKSLHFRTRSQRGNPEGKSILRSAYRAWYLKKNLEVIEGIGVERDLAGLPVMSIPSNLMASDASPEEQTLLAEMKKIVTTIRRDEQEGILMPLSYDEEGRPQFKLELLSTGGTRQFDTDKIITRYDNRIAMSMMADFFMLGQDATGSFALSSDKTELFATALGTILNAIVAEFNDHAIPKLVELNGFDPEMAPTMTHGDIETQNLGQLGAFIQTLANAGMVIFPNVELEKYLLETAGLPYDEDALGIGATPQGGILNPGPATVVGPETIPPPGTASPPPPAPGTSTPTGPVPPGAASGRRQAQPGVPGVGAHLGIPAQVSSSETFADCPTCSGSGKIRGGNVTCPDCDGEGTMVAYEAHEASMHHRHSIPLSKRFMNVSSKIQAKMDRSSYLEFLEAVMATGKFVDLDPRYKQAIRDAERS